MSYSLQSSLLSCIRPTFQTFCLPGQWWPNFSTESVTEQILSLLIMNCWSQKVIFQISHLDKSHHSLRLQKIVLLFLEAAWSDLRRWFTTLLTQKTLQYYANQEDQIFRFMLRTSVKLPRPSKVCIFKTSLSIWKMSLWRNNVCHSDSIIVGWGGVPRPNNGAQHWISGQKRVLIFAAHA